MITIINQPEAQSSGFNPNRWLIDSTKKSEVGFRYVISVQDGISGMEVNRFTVIPRPLDGYGEFDLSKLLQDYLQGLDAFSVLDSNYVYFHNAQRIMYRLEISEETFINWKYTDTEFISGSVTKCVASGSPVTPPFAPGDVVVVIPDDPSIRPAFQGLMNVLDVGVGWVSFETTWMSTPLNPGIIKFADNRKERSAPTRTSKLSVSKTAFPFMEYYPEIITNEYTAISASSKFLSNFKSGWTVKPHQDLYWWIGVVDKGSIVYTDPSGGTYSEPFTADAPKDYLFFNIFPKGLLPNDIPYFDVHLRNSDGDVVTETYRINIDRSCPSVDEISLLFEDRLGSYSSFAFEAMNTKNTTVTKEVYNQPIRMIGNGYDKAFAQGITTSTVDFTDTFTLRTKTILDREQDRYFEELITSGNVFMKWNGEYQRVNVLTTSVQTLNKKQSGLRRREITVQPANGDTINF